MKKMGVLAAIVAAMLVAGIGGLAIGRNLWHGASPAATQNGATYVYPENPVEVKFVQDLYSFIPGAFRVVEYYSQGDPSQRIDYAAFARDIPEGTQLRLSVVPYKVSADFVGNVETYNTVSFFSRDAYNYIYDADTLVFPERIFRVTRRSSESLEDFGEAWKPYLIYVKFSSGSLTDYQGRRLLNLVREAQRDGKPLTLEGYFYTMAKRDEGLSGRDNLLFEFVITKINGWEIKY